MHWQRRMAAGMLAAVVLGADGAAAGSPELCEAIAQADLGDLLTKGAELSVTGPLEYGGLRTVSCAFGPALGPTLIVNIGEDIGDQMPDTAAEAAAAEAAMLRMIEGPDHPLEDIAGLGAAAFWDPASGLLRVWPGDGQIAVQISVLGVEDPRSVAEEAARRVLAVLPAGG
ncbi:hypothetical protein ruthe_00667 [Rubellimicrobium thermophilum DSM 16684]|uniref:DUF3558 domain-containing protein n=1 Tax=Rubellimicrobium thermophilum DSM 16684 TaxID=1123069 RepID=S9SLI8_9RHOB|nr:hypothetical protein [Rubellimicrobium thermophilum]EPX87269.1 hypothetical protein ruthe_00667 [Rubellimicrobium thermophilum DSM 16684]